MEKHRRTHDDRPRASVLERSFSHESDFKSASARQRVTDVTKK
jgi:hypothetical protein